MWSPLTPLLPHRARQGCFEVGASAKAASTPRSRGFMRGRKDKDGARKAPPCLQSTRAQASPWCARRARPCSAEASATLLLLPGAAKLSGPPANARVDQRVLSMAWHPSERVLALAANSTLYLYSS